MQTAALGLRQVVGPLACALAFTQGCELSDILGKTHNSHVLVNVTTTHHASQVQGEPLTVATDGQLRVFDTDEGWSVTLSQAYVVTAGADLHRCDSTVETIDMYYGALAEDIKLHDYDELTLGASKVTPGDFCELAVHYGPYVDGQPFNAVMKEKVVDATFYLEGVAVRGAERVPFALRSTADITVNLDLSTIQGGNPMEVSGSEDFPVEVRGIASRAT